ncbi:MAG: protein jag [Selenomonadaceae bacterium]|nr:protein jag [Selenomonadaceae bacterium]
MALIKAAKTVEAALKAALQELNATAEQVEYEVLEAPSRGFLGLIGAKPAKIRVSLKVAPAPPEEQLAAPPVDTAEAEDKTIEAEAEAETKPESGATDESASAAATAEALKRAEDLLTKIIAAMGLTADFERRQDASGFVYHLQGDDLGILIGKHGQTLDALQYLLNLAANKTHRGERVRLMVEIGDYRQRREETLRRLAINIGDKVRRTREEVRLEPMNRHERKIIHASLQDMRGVTTYSDGDEPYRYVVITARRNYKGNRRDHDDRR